MESLSTAEKLDLAQTSFLRYQTRCFWYLRADFQVSSETLNTVINGLKKYGDREAFVIAQQLCH